jgi:hypothetical protein
VSTRSFKARSEHCPKINEKKIGSVLFAQIIKRMYPNAFKKRGRCHIPPGAQVVEVAHVYIVPFVLYSFLLFAFAGPTTRREKS